MIPSITLDITTADRKVGDLLFLWNRDAHLPASWARTSAPDVSTGLPWAPSARSSLPGAAGVFLSFSRDAKKGKHTWRVLVTLSNGSCVVWRLNARLFKRGWAEDAKGPVIEAHLGLR